MNRLFMHTFEFLNQPTFNIPELKVAYEWDLTKGEKPFGEITEDDVIKFFKDKRGDVCLDLEPTISPRYNSIRSCRDNILHLRKLARAMKSTREEGETYQTYGTPFFPDTYIGNGENAAMAIEQESLAAFSRSMELEECGNVTSFDLYFNSPNADLNVLLSLEKNISDAREFGRPVHVWMGVCRNGSPATVDLSLFSASTLFVASRLRETGDRIILWHPRTKLDAAGKYVPVDFKEVKPIIDHMGYLVEHVDKIKLY